MDSDNSIFNISSDTDSFEKSVSQQSSNQYNTADTAISISEDTFDEKEIEPSYDASNDSEMLAECSDDLEELANIKRKIQCTQATTNRERRIHNITSYSDSESSLEPDEWENSTKRNNDNINNYNSTSHNNNKTDNYNNNIDYNFNNIDNNNNVNHNNNKVDRYNNIDNNANNIDDNNKNNHNKVGNNNNNDDNNSNNVNTYNEKASHNNNKADTNKINHNDNKVDNNNNKNNNLNESPTKIKNFNKIYNQEEPPGYNNKEDEYSDDATPTESQDIEEADELKYHAIRTTILNRRIRTQAKRNYQLHLKSPTWPKNQSLLQLQQRRHESTHRISNWETTGI